MKTICTQKVFNVTLQLFIENDKMNSQENHAEKPQLKERIAMNAMRLFAEKGIKQVTMDDVAAGVGISKRTLYEQFPNKEELLVTGCIIHQQIMNEDLSLYCEQHDNVLLVILHFYEETVKHMAVIHPNFFEDLVRYPRMVEFIAQNDKEHIEESTRWLQRGIDQGLFRQDLNLEILLNVIHEAMKHVKTDTTLRRRFPPAELFSTIIFVLLRGMCTPKGQEILEQFIQQQKQNNNTLG